MTSSNNKNEIVRVYRKRRDDEQQGTGDETEFKEPEYRSRLPSEMVDRSKYSVWSILKQCVGKELYRFTTPIVFNEPLSLLQRLGESMRYSSMLDQSARAESPVDRLKYIVGFIIGCASVNGGRLSKPFNPLLGETFEIVSPKNGYRMCLEQVSHHPPVSAFHAESIRPGSPKWAYYGSDYPNVRLNILHGCIEATPEGILTIELPELGESYSWHGIRIFAHNLVIGKLWFEYSGRTEIVNNKNKMKAVIDFKPYSWFSGTTNRFDGFVCDANDVKKMLFYGKWDECLYAIKADSKSAGQFANRIEKVLSGKENEIANDRDIELVWETEDDSSIRQGGFQFDNKQYNYNSFTFRLNEIIPSLHEDMNSPQLVIKSSEKAGEEMVVSMGPLPRTDSRLRPDMRMYEEGKVDEASEEKTRLEEKQREVARQVERGETEKWVPCWFEKRKSSVQLDSIDQASHPHLIPHPSQHYDQNWIFKHTYWNRDFSKSPDIF